MENRNEQLALKRAFATKGFDLYIDKPELELQVYTLAAAKWSKNCDPPIVSRKFLAMGFLGKAGKPTFYFSFKTLESLDRYAAEFVANRATSVAFKAERKAAAAAPVNVNVGDIFRAVWGYDQTNIDYYEITRVIGKSTVEIRKIAGKGEDDGFMTGKCVPSPGQFQGDPMVKRIKNAGGTPAVTINSYCAAWRIEPQAIVAGVKVYAADRYSYYA